ncbi:hydroxyneurosporene-O-methyltransferase [Murinocardiopsis flavida]|uniref:Hydroxyneurosporene-O-methyltransferase n=1 Tax=Murinocardiopsis flavida TaxID=645275 RepID=A0A2P8DU69_9ACTN|nr:methyltransferase [Murinocardiopsis flavida]PSL00767.1 hydroxyneurosporene-O-methyltransferase [Murinocardiopsis flavida]
MADDHIPRTMLNLMTGAWTTKAIFVTVKLGVIDAMDGDPVSGAELARRTGTDPDALVRLLRLLTGLGIVDSTGDGFTTTPLGDSLRSDDTGSMRDLALIYGDPFYDAWGRFEDVVRTGRESFSTVYGKPFFEYANGEPELARTFDRAMSAGSVFFAEVPRAVELAGVRGIVDIAGGSGALLETLLAAAPEAQGVLLERADVLEPVRRRIEGTAVADRLDLRTGDFFQAVPEGADLYVLSRILHDWGDGECSSILANCAAAMGPDSRLLIIERPLDPGRPASFASYWDLHMLVVMTGARERTPDEYDRLLAGAGLVPAARHPLPLDMEVLEARLA